MNATLIFNKVFPIVVAGMVSVFHCTPTGQAGNSTQTGNGVVVGSLLEPDGKTAAVHVKVTIRPRNTLADTAGFALGKRMADTATVVTDNAGRFTFDTVLDTGTYVIEATRGNDAVFIDSVAVTSKDSTDSLPADTLKSAGALKGIVKLPEGGDPRKVFVLAFGIDRFARVEADGSFRFSGLAEGKYDLRLISSLDDYGVLDTGDVGVKAGDTVNLGTIGLPFVGIPVVRGVKTTYDALKKIVTLTWDKSTTGRPVTGYIIYRKHQDSNFVKIKDDWQDTIYQDSAVIQDILYIYRVAALDSNGTEGVNSSADTVTVPPFYSFEKGWGSMQCADNQSCTPSSMTMDSNGDLYVTNRGVNNVVKYDTMGNLLLKIGATGSDSGKFQKPWDVEVDRNGHVFVADYGNERIQRFDQQGHVDLIVHCDSAAIGFSAKPRLLQIDSMDNIYAIVIKSGDAADKLYQSFVKYNNTGAFISSTNIATLIGAAPTQDGTGLAQDMVFHNGRIFISSAPGVLFVFSNDLTPIGRIEPVRYPLAIANDSLLYCGGSNLNFYSEGPVRIIDLEGNFIARFGKQPEISNQATWTNSISISLTGLVVDSKSNVYSCEIDGTNYAIKKFIR